MLGLWRLLWWEIQQVQMRSEFECGWGEVEMWSAEVSSGRAGREHRADLGIICCTNIAWEAAWLVSVKKAVPRESQTFHSAAQGELHTTKYVVGFGPTASCWWGLGWRSLLLGTQLWTTWWGCREGLKNMIWGRLIRLVNLKNQLKQDMLVGSRFTSLLPKEGSYLLHVQPVWTQAPL